MQWRHVVAVCDGTPNSRTAALRAENIAAELGCRCSVLFPTDRAGTLPDFANAIPIPGVPSIEVPRWAEAHGADVIVLPGGWALYQQFAAIIRRSVVPCLLIPAWQERCGFLHVALDRTERGLQLLGPSLTAAASLHADLDYVSVTSPGDECVAAAWLRDRARVPAQTVTIMTGAPVPTLATFMAHSHDGVLVLGVRHGRSGSQLESSGVGRSLLGTADCAFLTVPL